MKIKYCESSQYGQEVLELVGLVAELQDPDKEMTKTEIMQILRIIKTYAEIIKIGVSKLGFDYFKEVEE